MEHFGIFSFPSWAAVASAGRPAGWTLVGPPRLWLLYLAVPQLFGVLVGICPLLILTVT